MDMGVPVNRTQHNGSRTCLRLHLGMSCTKPLATKGLAADCNRLPMSFRTEIDDPRSGNFGSQAIHNCRLEAVTLQSIVAVIAVGPTGIAPLLAKRIRSKI